MRSKDFLLIILSILFLMLLSCDNVKKKVEEPPLIEDEFHDVVTLYRTAPIGDLRVSNDNIVFDRLTVNRNAIYAISFTNNNPRYPAKLSFRWLSEDIKFDERSTCKLTNNIILPKDTCVAVFSFTPTSKQPISGVVKYTDGINYRDISYRVDNIVDDQPIQSDISSSLLIIKNLGEKGDVVDFTISNQTYSTVNIDIPTITDGFRIYQLSKCKEGTNTIAPRSSCVLSVMMSTQTELQPLSNTVIKVKVISGDGEFNNINLSLSSFYHDMYNESIDNLSISENELDFGVILNDVRVRRGFSIENRSPFNNIKYQIESPTDNFRYDELSTCGLNGGILERGASCDYVLYLTPQKLGDINDVIKVYVKSSDKSVSLKAVKDAKPLISVSNKVIDFGLIDNKTVTTRYIDIENISTTLVDLKFEGVEPLIIDNSSNISSISRCERDGSKLNINGDKCRLILKVENDSNIPSSIVLSANDVKYTIPIAYNSTNSSANSAINLGDYDIVSASISPFYDKIIFFKITQDKKIMSLLDPMSGEFEDLYPPSTSLLPDIDNASISYLNDTLYIFGGDNATGELKNQLYSYTLSQNQFRLVRSKGSLPEPRKNHIMLIADRKIFIYGGVDKNNTPMNDLYMLDLAVEDKSWEQIINGNLNTVKDSMRLGFVDEEEEVLYFLSDSALYSYKYLVGGYKLSEVKKLSFDISNSSLTVADGVIYAINKVDGSISSFDFRKDDDFRNVDISSEYKPSGYDKVKMVSIDKRIYLFTTSATDKVVTDSFLFDILASYYTNQSLSVGLRSLSDNATSAIVDDKIYYFDFDNGKVIAFDINSDNFKELTVTGMPLTNGKYVTVTVGDEIYLLSSDTTKFYIFNTGGNSFADNETTGITPSDRSGFTLNYHNHSIYLYGGRDSSNNNVLDDFYKYDTTATVGGVGNWSKIPTTGSIGGLDNHSSVVVGDDIYIVGGHDGTDNSSKLHRYDTTTSSFNSPLDNVTLKDGFCKIFLVDGEIYVSVNGNVKRYDSTGNTLEDVDILGDGVLLKDTYLSVVYGRLIYNFNKKVSKFDRILLRN